jgi:hypothetical protein
MQLPIYELPTPVPGATHLRLDYIGVDANLVRFNATLGTLNEDGAFVANPLMAQQFRDLSASLQISMQEALGEQFNAWAILHLNEVLYGAEPEPEVTEPETETEEPTDV